MNSVGEARALASYERETILWTPRALENKGVEALGRPWMVATSDMGKCYGGSLGESQVAPACRGGFVPTKCSQPNMSSRDQGVGFANSLIHDSRPTNDLEIAGTTSFSTLVLDPRFKNNKTSLVNEDKGLSLV